MNGLMGRRYFSPADPPAAPPATPPGTPPAPTPGTPPAAPPTPPAFFIKPDGTYTEKFWEHPAFPAELKDNVQIRTHKTVADTLNNWGSLHKSFGFDKIAIPGKDAPPEVWDQNVWHRLGTPKDPKGYEVPDYNATGMDPKYKATDKQVQSFVEGAHKARLTTWQFKQLATHMNEVGKAALAEEQQAQAAAKAQAMQPLQQEWGGSFDANTKAVETFLRSRVPADRIKAVLATGILEEPAVLKFLFEDAKAFGELQSDLALANTPANVVASAEEEVAKLTASTAYTSEFDPQHAATVKRVNELRNMVFAAQGKQG
jgi:hypothetical protein